MLKRLHTKLLALWRPVKESGAQGLLHWGALSIVLALALLLLQVCGFFAVLEEWQIIILAGDPFQMSAMDAQVTFLSPWEMYGLSVLLLLYLGAVLLRQPSLLKRTHVCLLAAVEVTLPGLMCVLWHGVLYVGQPLASVLLLWLALVPIFFIRKLLKSTK